MDRTVNGLVIPALVILLLACGDDRGSSEDDKGGASEVEDAGPGDAGRAAVDAAAKLPQRISEPGRYRGYSERIYDDFEISSRYVAVRDGTELAMDIYRPLDKDGVLVETPLPVLWMHTPYGRRAPVDVPGFTIGQVYPGAAAKLVDYGYVVAIVDFRGLYASYGRNMGYNRGEWVEAARMDAYDITEWLAEQPWSTGEIGMWGCSATGGSQLQAATTAPPSLKAVFPMSCEFDAYPFGVPGGMAPPDGPTRSPPSTMDQATRNMLAAPVDDDVDGSQLQEAIASHGEPLDNLGYVPFRDSVPPAPAPAVEWWTESSPHTYLEQLNGSNTAFYVAANWDEAATKYGAFFTFKNLTRPAKLLIGPAPHCAWDEIPLQGEGATVVGETGFEITVEELRFFDYWLKGIDNGIRDEPRVYYYTYGAPEDEAWSAAASWPLPNEKRVPYYFGDGLLSTEAPSEAMASDHFAVSYEANAESPAEYGLVYETPPLERALRVTGHPVVHMWLSSTAEDCDVVAYVQNVAPDGGTTSYSMHGRLRASLRREASPPYDNLGLPWHPFREADAQPLSPGKPVELRFDVLPFSMVFDVGHRIRLVVTFADAATPRFEPAPTVSIYRDASRPSRIILPIIEP